MVVSDKDKDKGKGKGTQTKRPISISSSARPASTVANESMMEAQRESIDAIAQLRRDELMERKQLRSKQAANESPRLALEEERLQRELEY